MQKKILIIADPGIDTAFAVALALHDPRLDVLGIIASAGNISSERATQNVHLLINAIDPPKWPRLGAALSITYAVDGIKLHGPDGLGDVQLPPVTLHQPTPGDKLIVELVRANPHEVSILVLGPATMLVRAFDRDPELPNLIQRTIFLGGAWHDPGNATAVAEFHCYCDPESARRLLQEAAPVTLLSLDVTRKLIFSPSDLLELPNPESATCRFLRKIVPFGIRACSNLYGIEGFHLKDVLGIVAVSIPERITLEPVSVDIELKGELTRGMTVFDARSNRPTKANAEFATAIDIVAIRDYIAKILREAE